MLPHLSLSLSLSLSLFDLLFAEITDNPASVMVAETNYGIKCTSPLILLIYTWIPWLCGMRLWVIGVIPVNCMSWVNIFPFHTGLFRRMGYYSLIDAIRGWASQLSIDEPNELEILLIFLFFQTDRYCHLRHWYYCIWQEYVDIYVPPFQVQLVCRSAGIFLQNHAAIP